MPLLSHLPSGETLFIDANIFLEHLINSEPSSTNLFHRLRTGEVRGVTSVLVLAEVRHRLLLVEAVRQGLVKPTHRALEAIRKHPDILQKLTVCDTVLNNLLEIPLRITGVTLTQFHKAQQLSIRRHLLTNDALHLAAMDSLGIKHLASADKDFRSVSSITVWFL